MARVDPHNKADYWRDPRYPGMTLLCADFSTQEFAPHSHDALVIAATESGGAEIKSRGAVHQAVSSRLFVFNPTEPHCGWMGQSRRWRYRSLYLTQSTLDAINGGLGRTETPGFTYNQIDDPQLCEAFLSLHRGLQTGADAFCNEESLLSSFGRLYDRYGSARSPRPLSQRDQSLVRRTADIMRSHYNEELTLSDLSTAVGLRKVQLIDLFNRTVGMGPHAYLTQIRLKAACHRLKRGDAPADVAAAAGFYDQSAMNRHFKRAYGITPLQYAGRRRSGELFANTAADRVR